MKGGRWPVPDEYGAPPARDQTPRALGIIPSPTAPWRVASRPRHNPLPLLGASPRIRGESL
eukprot:2560687-Prymnesium_polylepis.2